MRKWKLAFLAGLGYASMPAEQVIASLRKLGYEGIEWTGAHFNPDLPVSRLKELVQRTRDAGMEVSRVAGIEDLVCLDDGERRRRIERIIRRIEAAGMCGVASVGISTGPFVWDPKAPKIGQDISEGAAWSQVLEAYEIITPVARAAKVVTTTEGIFGTLTHDFYSHWFLMNRIDSQVHKVNLDPSHGTLYGNFDTGWVVRQWGKRIGHVHLKDAVGVPELGRFLFPLLGEGRVDWKGFFAALDEIGYDGFCSVEFESFAYYERVLKGDPEAAARISMEQVKALTGA
ncbi:MAG: sugar phosphate isomerase/epimerase family protein [Phycisphaerae bacterium]